MKTKLLTFVGLFALLINARGQPGDLWRIVDGVTNCICGPGFNDYYFAKDDGLWARHGSKNVLASGWVMAEGKVIEVQPLGIRVRGYTGFDASDLAAYKRSDYQDTHVYHREGYELREKVFFIANYPYQVADNDALGMCAVKEAGVYTYTTVSGGSASIHKFDYCLVTTRPIAPPPTAEQVQAAKAATAIKKAELQANAVKYEKEMADKGDSYSQRRLGERFRDGDSVEKSLMEARRWFALAAGQGDKDAARELGELPPK